MAEAPLGEGCHLSINALAFLAESPLRQGGLPPFSLPIEVFYYLRTVYKQAVRKGNSASGRPQSLSYNATHAPCGAQLWTILSSIENCLWNLEFYIWLAC